MCSAIPKENDNFFEPWEMAKDVHISSLPKRKDLYPGEIQMLFKFNSSDF